MVVSALWDGAERLLVSLKVGPSERGAVSREELEQQLQDIADGAAEEAGKSIVV